MFSPTGKTLKEKKSEVAGTWQENKVTDRQTSRVLINSRARKSSKTQRGGLSMSSRCLSALMEHFIFTSHIISPVHYFTLLSDSCRLWLFPNGVRFGCVPKSSAAYIGFYTEMKTLHRLYTISSSVPHSNTNGINYKCFFPAVLGWIFFSAHYHYILCYRCTQCCKMGFLKGQRNFITRFWNGDFNCLPETNKI